ncbi:unnamed protein product [Closterium sp. Naga37s-1]|nr:unnamed protein product [Closterium sp. Naga37s-1]
MSSERTRGGSGGEDAEESRSTPGGNGEEEAGQWKEKALSLEKAVAVLEARVAELERALEKERKERAAERKGRIRAEQQLRSRLLAPAAAEPASPVRAHGALAAELPQEGGSHGDARDGGHSDGHGDGNSVTESDAREQSEGCDVAVTQHGHVSKMELLFFSSSPLTLFFPYHHLLPSPLSFSSPSLLTPPFPSQRFPPSHLHPPLCTACRNGTPRQPLLVPAARAYLELPRGGVSPAALEGLEGYSHCWLLYVFHANTDIQRLWSDPHHRKFRAKVRVPRLQGGKLGALATRTPHRPVPIGLSIARVERVEGRRVLLSGADLVDGTAHRPVPIGLSIARVERVEGRRVLLSGADLVDGTAHRPVPIGLSIARVERVEGRRVLLSGADLVDGTPEPIGLSITKVERVEGRRVFLSGADIVDGTPVLDIKPYLPYSDALPSATVPQWVEPSGEGDGMHMVSVTFHPAIS